MNWDDIKDKWRQGNIVNINDSNLIDIYDDLNYAIVVSHNCDIVSDINKEPFIELICGKIIDEYNGNFLYAKNPRTLHLKIKDGEIYRYIELQAPIRKQLKKESIDFLPDQNKTFEDNNSINILVDWLSARYNRQALPDSLVSRFKKLFSYIEKLCKNNSEGILGIWMNYDPFNCELSENEPYEISIFIIYSLQKTDYKKSAEDIADEIKRKFNSLYDDKEILGECRHYSEEEFTLKDLQNNIRYRFDYISNKQEHPSI